MANHTRPTTSHAGRLLVAECTVLVLQPSYTLADRSTARGVAAVHLARLDEGRTVIHLRPVQRHANLQRAQAISTLVCFWEAIQEGRDKAVILATPLVAVSFNPPWHYVLVMSNVLSTKSKAAVQRLQAGGMRIGLQRLGVLRPLPALLVQSCKPSSLTCAL